MATRLLPALVVPCRPDARSPEEIVIRFVCVRPSHVASTVPGKLGSLVTRSGTCGYCPGQAVTGSHAWENNIRLTLAELLRRGRSASPARARDVKPSWSRGRIERPRSGGARDVRTHRRGRGR